jgi:hypothetical protein
VSVITVAELRLGVLAAASPPIRARRLETLSKVEALDPLLIDRAAAHAWAVLRLALHNQGKRMPINDSWIAATAVSDRDRWPSRTTTMTTCQASQSSRSSPYGSA